MQLSNYIKKVAGDCAEQHEEGKLPLPAKIPGSTSIYIGREGEGKIMAFGQIVSQSGQTYLIGSLVDPATAS